jgi:hypothetical protein
MLHAGRAQVRRRQTHDFLASILCMSGGPLALACVSEIDGS